MKTAILKLISFSIVCPFCEALQTAPNGSEFFTPAEVVPGEIRTCKVGEEGCGRDFRLPSTLRATGRGEV